MTNQEIESNSIYSSIEKKEELRQRYLEIIQFQGTDFPTNLDAVKLASEFMESQMEEFNWPEDQRFKYEENSTYQDILFSSYETMVEKSIRYYGKGHPDLIDIFAGPINLGTFEATLRTMFGDGSLILINSGLQSMMWQCGKVIVNSVLTETDRPESLYDGATAAAFLLNIIYQAAEGDPRRASQTHFNSPSAMVLAGAMADSATQFIISHEIAHLTEDTKIELKSDEYELRADALAMEVIIKEYNTYKESVNGKISNNHRVRLVCHFLAPVLMMEVWYLKRCCEAFKNGAKEIKYGGYPSDLTRRDNLIAILVRCGFWSQIEDNYVKFSKCIDIAYKQLINMHQEKENFCLENLTVSETKNGLPSSNPLFETTMFSNDRVSLLAAIKQDFEKRFSTMGVNVSVDPDIIKHKE